MSRFLCAGWDGSGGTRPHPCSLPKKDHIARPLGRERRAVGEGGGVVCPSRHSVESHLTRLKWGAASSFEGAVIDILGGNKEVKLERECRFASIAPVDSGYSTVRYMSKRAGFHSPDPSLNSLFARISKLRPEDRAYLETIVARLEG